MLSCARIHAVRVMILVATAVVSKVRHVIAMSAACVELPNPHADFDLLGDLSAFGPAPVLALSREPSKPAAPQDATQSEAAPGPGAARPVIRLPSFSATATKAAAGHGVRLGGATGGAAALPLHSLGVNGASGRDGGSGTDGGGNGGGSSAGNVRGAPCGRPAAGSGRAFRPPRLQPRTQPPPNAASRSASNGGAAEPHSSARNDAAGGSSGAAQPAGAVEAPAGQAAQLRGGDGAKHGGGGGASLPRTDAQQPRSGMPPSDVRKTGGGAAAAQAGAAAAAPPQPAVRDGSAAAPQASRFQRQSPPIPDNGRSTEQHRRPSPQPAGYSTPRPDGTSRQPSDRHASPRYPHQ